MTYEVDDLYIAIKNCRRISGFSVAIVFDKVYKQQSFLTALRGTDSDNEWHVVASDRSIRFANGSIIKTFHGDSIDYSTDIHRKFNSIVFEGEFNCEFMERIHRLWFDPDIDTWVNNEEIDDFLNAFAIVE